MNFTKEELEKLEKFVAGQLNQGEPKPVDKPAEPETKAMNTTQKPEIEDEKIKSIVTGVLAEFAKEQKEEAEKEAKLNAKKQPTFQAPAVVMKTGYDEKPNFLGAFCRVGIKAKSDNLPMKKAAEWWADKSRTTGAGFVMEKAVNESVFDEGGVFSVPEISNQIIELLTAENKFRQIEGINQIQTKSAQFEMKKITQGATAYWEGENDIDGATSSFEFGNIISTPKKIYAAATITKDMLADNGPGVEQIIQRLLIQKVAEKENLAFYNGLGSEYQPKGLYYWLDSDNINATAGTTAAQSETDIKKILEKIEGNNVKGPITFIMPYRTRNSYRTLREATTNKVQWPGLRESTLNLWGYPLLVDNNLPLDLGGATNTQIWGVSGNHVTILDRQDMQIEFDPVQNDSNIEHKLGEHLITLIKRVDLIAHHGYAASVIEDVTI